MIIIIILMIIIMNILRPGRLHALGGHLPGPDDPAPGAAGARKIVILRYYIKVL